MSVTSFQAVTELATTACPWICRFVHLSICRFVCQHDFYTSTLADLDETFRVCWVYAPVVQPSFWSRSVFRMLRKLRKTWFLRSEIACALDGLICIFGACWAVCAVACGARTLYNGTHASNGGHNALLFQGSGFGGVHNTAGVGGFKSHDGGFMIQTACVQGHGQATSGSFKPR